MPVPYQINRCINISEIFSMFETHYDKGFEFLGETHNFWECLYVIDGEVCVSGDERIYNLCKGDIIFHRPMELHKFHVECENGVDIFVFSFFADGDIIGFFERKVFKLLDYQQEVVGNLLSYARDCYKNLQVSDTGYRMYMECFNHSKTYSHMIETYITQLFLLLYDDNSDADVLYTPETIVFNTAVKCMSRQLNKNVSVDEIAYECNVSTSTLKRIFTKYAGMSVHKYFITLKMQAAVDLLNKGTSVTEISEKLGFAGQSYFSAAFKRELGISPAKYNKNEGDL